MKRDLLTIPNGLSALRILLVIPFFAVIFSNRSDARWWGVVLMVIAALTDKFDGMVARKLHCETEWGRILDPLADKIGVGAVAIGLLLKSWLPAWFVIVLLVRDLFILIGGLIIKRSTGEIVPSNLAGKWAVGIIGLTLTVALIDDTTPVLGICIAASLVMVILSTAGYVKRFLQIIHLAPLQ
jgi:CDP-diacylglycerol--glycerol-3-phosphate 3-phosphatidyltransferase